MKKKLLAGAMLLGTAALSYAQYNTSFEAAQGFTIGNLIEQSGWGVTHFDDINTLEGVSVTDEKATDGTQAIKIAMDESMPDFDDTDAGLFSPEFDADGALLTITFDMFIELDDNAATTGSDYTIKLQSNQEKMLIAAIVFGTRFDNEIYLMDMEDGAPALINTGIAFTPGEWQTVTIDVDFEAGTIIYKLDGDIIHEGTVWTEGMHIDNFVILHNNHEGSAMYFDNFSVGNTVAGTNDAIAGAFSLYPNPAQDIVTISNTTGALLHDITVKDLNGRTVKSIGAKGMEQVQVNTGDLASGTYLATIVSDAGTVTKKFIKR